LIRIARMVKLVDTSDLKSEGCIVVPVQVRLRAPFIRTTDFGPLAHAWLEQRTHNPLVPCSTHGRPTRFQYFQIILSWEFIMSQVFKNQKGKKDADRKLICYSITDLISAGYTETNESYPNMPGFSVMRQIAIKKDMPIEAFSSYRISEFDWHVFVRPGYESSSGFIDHPMMLF
jgi:hypothetical protein